jgi:pseudouridine kinase
MDWTPRPEQPVLVIGAAGVDLVGRLDAELALGTSSPAQIRTSYGGVARNVAENLARLGQPVALLTAVGRDGLGERLLEHAAQAGIDVGGVLQVEEQPTGTYLAVVNARGEMQFGLDDMRVMGRVTSAYLNGQMERFRQASLVFVDANLGPGALRTVMSLARKARLPVCADPTSARLAARLKPYLSQLFLITPNSAEAEVFCGEPLERGDRTRARQVARYLVAQGVGIALVTLAEFGVCYATSEASGYAPAIRTAIVDPTGAGDAMSAALIFALLNEIPIDDAVRLGVSAASLTLEHRGAVRPDLSLEKLYNHLVI